VVSRVVGDALGGWVAEECDRDAGPASGGRLDIGVLVVDDERRVVVVNQALQDLMGPAGPELLGAPAEVWAAMPGLAVFAAAMEGAGSTRARSADGHVRHGTWHAVPSGRMLTVHEATPAAYGRVLATSRTELVSALLHELRTPLTTLASTVEHLPEPDDETAPVYELIRRTTHRMRDVLAELAGVADLESGGAALDETRVDLGQIVGETVAAWRARDDLEVAVVPAVSGRQFVHGDAHWLAVMVDRLIAVAVTAASPGLPVTVTAIGAPDGWTLRLPVDSGLASHRLFTRIGEKSNATALMLARAVIARHRGGLTVSTRDGRAELCVTIPAGAVPAAHEAAHRRG
jgi:signal transduction histidine kinase